MSIYAVRNSKGEYFSRKSRCGATWVPELSRARLYGSIGYARTAAMSLANSRPPEEGLQIVEFAVAETQVFEEAERIEGQRKKKADWEAKSKVEWAKTRLEKAEKELERARSDYENLNT